jgi:hypothetical protein
VTRFTTTTASESIDRQKLEWDAEPVRRPEQRARFQKVMDEDFGAEPAPIAKTLAHVLKLRDDIRAKRTTMQRQRRRLPSVRPDERDHLALLHLQGHTLERLDDAEKDAQVLDLKERAHGEPASWPR